MARLYGENEDINSDKVKDFFNDRAILRLVVELEDGLKLYMISVIIF